MVNREDALTAVVVAYGPQLLRYGQLLTGSTADGEDLVQDAIVRTFTRLPSRKIASSLPLTLYTYVHRTMFTMYIDQKRRSARWRELTVKVARVDTVPDVSTEASDRHDVTRALTCLSPTQRACIILRYFDDLTVPQIAERLQMSSGTAKRHLHDAIERLRATNLLPKETTVTFAEED